MLHIYDITRGVVQPDDTLVVLDDSIVRGTTLRESIITILSRLNPRRIIVISSAPPIMYPDCYGIDMSQLGRFIAFEAAVEACSASGGEEGLLDEVEERCLAQADMRPPGGGSRTTWASDLRSLHARGDCRRRWPSSCARRSIDWKAAKSTIIYQTVDGLRARDARATPGDWYFTGRYPTPGGYRVLNTSYLNWRRSADVRAY